MPDEPLPDDAAGLRAANARLRGRWWRRRTRRSRGCGTGWTRSGSCSGGWSCGWRSWSAGWGWTAAIRGRLLRGSGSGRGRRGGRRQQSERERRKDRRPGGQPGHQGKGLASGSRSRVSGRTRGPPAECRRCGAGLGGAEPSGEPRWAQVIDVRGRPEGDRVGAAGPGVPVLRDGHVRGAAARRARGRGVLRARAERGRGPADRLRERAAGAGRAGDRHAAGRPAASAGWVDKAVGPAVGAARGRPGSRRRCSPRWPARRCWPPTRPR